MLETLAQSMISANDDLPATSLPRTRPARLPDALPIFSLVNSLSHDGTLLRRSYAEICENVRDFTVAETQNGDFLGCGALHLYGPHLAEIRSVVVRSESSGMGAGKALLQALLADAAMQSVSCVCLFTRIPDFFSRFNFRVVDRTQLPDKIYKDCQTCPRLYACDEFAMAVGDLPRISVLGPTKFSPPDLVKLQAGTLHKSHETRDAERPR